MKDLEIRIGEDLVELSSDDKEVVAAAVVAVAFAVWPGFITNEQTRETNANCIAEAEPGRWSAKVQRKGFYTSEVHKKMSRILYAGGVDVRLNLIF